MPRRSHKKFLKDLTNYLCATLMFGIATVVAIKPAKIGIENIITFGKRAVGYIVEKDFQNAQWLPYENENGMIYSCYTFEKIPYHEDNYKLYRREVYTRNLKNRGVKTNFDKLSIDELEKLCIKHKALENLIELPDLDHNGKVEK